MARENVYEKTESRVERNEPTNGSGGSNHLEVTCPRCDSGWTCAHPADSTCPECGASFSVRVRDEFALVERGGWTVAVSLDSTDRQGVAGDG